VDRQQRRHKLEVTVLDALTLATLPRQVLLARIASAARRGPSASKTSHLALARLLYDDRNDQGRFLIDVQTEIDRQTTVHRERRDAAISMLGTIACSRSGRLQLIGARVFGHPMSWIGAKRPETSWFSSVTAEWIRIYDGTVVACLSAAENVCESNYAFVYRPLQLDIVRCVAIPRMTQGLPGLFEMLGLHRRTQELAKFTVDWEAQLFRVNGRDTIHWVYG
jgi:hypothetical protein